jgi:type II secretory pathway pseudopilin PulG
MKLSAQRRRGLSWIEVAFVLATLALLAAVFLPSLARPRRANRVSCMLNLKQIGLAARIYASDHNDQFPFAIAGERGSQSHVNSPNVFRHFAVMSNELNNPKILVCPSDRERTRAPDFARLSNKTLSYFLALDADEAHPERLLSGDRNITGGVLSNGFMRILQTDSAAGWSPTLHTNVGNVALSDGSGWQTSPTRLQQLLSTQSLAVIRLAIP